MLPNIKHVEPRPVTEREKEREREREERRGEERREKEKKNEKIFSKRGEKKNLFLHHKNPARLPSSFVVLLWFK